MFHDATSCCTLSVPPSDSAETVGSQVAREFRALGVFLFPDADILAEAATKAPRHDPIAAPTSASRSQSGGS